MAMLALGCVPKTGDVSAAAIGSRLWTSMATG
jgi:hypothetical protein